jgi:tRNA A37 threonylcarbamoyladenosine dehydratase
MNQYTRTKIIMGEAFDELKNKTVAIFGVGGVGGYVVEALARSGIRHLVLIDHDDVDLTNLNRQIIATLDTIGEDKVDVMAKRIASIDPEIKVECKKTFYLPENKADFDFSSYDYVVDAIDTILAKVSLIEECNKSHTPIISSMGMGNKIDPEMIRIDDIYKTRVDPLSKVMRQQLRKRHIKKCTVCYSIEKPLTPNYDEEMLSEMKKKEEAGYRKAIPGSIAFVPSVAGLMMAGYVVRDLAHLKAIKGC